MEQYQHYGSSPSGSTPRVLPSPPDIKSPRVKPEGDDLREKDKP